VTALGAEGSGLLGAQDRSRGQLDNADGSTGARIRLGEDVLDGPHEWGLRSMWGLI
jgi:hypothetical protein